MTATTQAKIAELRAKGLFAGWSDERVARMLGRTAGFHAHVASASARLGNAQQAKDAARVARTMVRECGLEAGR